MRFWKLRHAVVMGALGYAALGMTSVEAQQAAYVGEIKFVAFSFCPLGWAEANGQTLPVTSNQALFALIGTTYGGDGTTTFALPNVQGVVSGPGLLTPAPGVSQQLIKQHPFKKQEIKRQKIRQQGVEEQPEPEQPAPGSTTGTPLLACIALQGVLPSDPTASPTPEPTPEEPPPTTEE